MRNPGTLVAKQDLVDWEHTLQMVSRGLKLRLQRNMRIRDEVAMIEDIMASMYEYILVKPEEGKVDE